MNLPSLNDLKTRWKAPAVAMAVVLAFATGRFLAPIKTVYKAAEAHVEAKAQETKTDKTHEETKAQVVYRDRTVIRYKDGTEEHRDVERTQDVATTRTEVEKDKKAQSITTEVKVSEKTTERAQSDLHLSALVGINNHLDPVLGAQVEKRVLGPIWLGAWGVGSKSGEVAGGLSVGLSF